MNFLGWCQQQGTKSNPIESYKVITGDNATRIANLQEAFSRIMQDQVQVSLIE